MTDAGDSHTCARIGRIIVILIGLGAGFTAGILDMCNAWISDLKQGICVSAFWLAQKQCCWGQELTGAASCPQWQTWSQLAGKYGANAYALNYFIYILIAAIFSAMSAFLVKRLAPYAAGSGLAEIKVILGGFIIRGYFGGWTLVVKAFGLILAIGAGMNLGFEGPMVHISLCLGNIFTRFFPKFNTNEAKRREMLSASAAIGVAAAFNAPIGGVLFSLEEVSYYFPHKTMWRSFFGCLVAAITLSYMNPLSYREMTFNDRIWHWFEFIPFALLGVFGVSLYIVVAVHSLTSPGSLWRVVLLAQRQVLCSAQEDDIWQMANHRGHSCCCRDRYSQLSKRICSV